MEKFLKTYGNSLPQTPSRQLDTCSSARHTFHSNINKNIYSEDINQIPTSVGRNCKLVLQPWDLPSRNTFNVSKPLPALPNNSDN